MTDSERYGYMSADGRVHYLIWRDGKWIDDDDDPQPTVQDHPNGSQDA